MAIAGQRDAGEVRAGLARWCGAAVSELEQPAAGGLSSDTYLFRAHGTELVARLPPAGAGLFAAYDLGAQARVMRALGAAGVVPVPEVVELVEDPSYLGAPFLVMRRVAGRVPSDQPSYLAAGWVHEAGAAGQRRLHDAFLDACARIHTCDWRALGLGAIARPGGTGLDADLAWWRDYLAWASEGAPPPLLADALTWCRDAMPRDELPASLLWGDVRIPNVVFVGSEPAAVLDWEMASIGPAEIDLGWFLAVHAVSVAVAGSDLPGFPARTELLAGYEERLGRPLAPMHWFEVWGTLRAAMTMVRLGRLLYDLGLVGDLTMQARNPCTRHLHNLLAHR